MASGGIQLAGEKAILMDRSKPKTSSTPALDGLPEIVAILRSSHSNDGELGVPPVECDPLQFLSGHVQGLRDGKTFFQGWIAFSRRGRHDDGWSQNADHTFLTSRSTRSHIRCCPSVFPIALLDVFVWVRIPCILRFLAAYYCSAWKVPVDPVA